MKIYSISIVLFYLFTNNLYFAQNPSYKFFWDSIDPILITNYPKAKELFISLEKKHEIDPNIKKFLAVKSLQKNDIEYFKITMQNLIEKQGYKYSKYDLSLESKESSEEKLSSLLKEKKMENWMFQQSDSLYPVWVKNNPKSFEVKKKIEELSILDQAMRVGFTDLDSVVWDVIAKKDYASLKILLKLCDSNGILPNDFDQGIGVYINWSFVFLHNIKSYQTFEIWNEMFPYIEKTYLAGKITSDCFLMYDLTLAQFYGYQYYGFLKDVPIKDEEHLAERKKKYGFL